MKPLVLIFCLLSAACSPFLEYEHLSDPRVSNDGYDLLCAGGQSEWVSVAMCQNVALYGGQYVKVNARYVWDE